MACSRGCCPSPRDHYRSIGIAAAALPNGGAGVAAIDAKQRRWDRDLPAYRELRRQGYRPPGIDGSDRLAGDAKCDDHINTGLVDVKPTAFGAFTETFGHRATEPSPSSAS